MCIVKTPKIKPGDTTPPEPTVVRNPFLDGMGPENRALRRGRSSLRIERGRGGRTTAPSPSAPPIMTPAPTPSLPGLPRVIRGGGGGGRVDPGFRNNPNIY